MTLIVIGSGQGPRCDRFRIDSCAANWVRLRQSQRWTTARSMRKWRCRAGRRAVFTPVRGRERGRHPLLVGMRVRPAGRVCLADVAGHGSDVAAVGAEMHAHLRRSVDVIDERKVLSRLNRRLNERGLGVMTTAVLATYYPPRRRLTVGYAGHPTGWLFRADTGAWTPLCGPVPPPQKPGFVDLPMGIGFTPTYSRHRFRISRRPHAALHRRRDRDHIARRHAV